MEEKKIYRRSASYWLVWSLIRIFPLSIIFALIIMLSSAPKKEWMVSIPGLIFILFILSFIILIAYATLSTIKRVEITNKGLTYYNLIRKKEIMFSEIDHVYVTRNRPNSRGLIESSMMIVLKSGSTHKINSPGAFMNGQELINTFKDKCK